jgi:heme/copper-type cytochrome/quinol oxidase subunit 3
MEERDPGIQETLEPTSLGVDSRKMGIWVFLASEAVFFGGLITTYVVESVRTVQGPFPSDVLSIPLVSVNTFVLIASSLAMVTALSHAQDEDIRGAVRWLVATAILGLAFLGGQAYEFIHLYIDGVSLSTNLFGASFFTLTGTHGLHVLSGIIWIILVIFQLRRFQGAPGQAAMKVELTGLYWHFVDLIWIIIFTVVYLLRLK